MFDRTIPPLGELPNIERMIMAAALMITYEKIFKEERNND